MLTGAGVSTASDIPDFRSPVSLSTNDQVRASPGLDELLRQLVETQASDLHLKPTRPPLMRINGQLTPLDLPALDPDTINALLEPIIPEFLRPRLSEKMAIDFGYGVPGVSRFRASIFGQRGTRAAVFRRVPYDFPSLEDWGLPTILAEFCKLPQGLVLFTGPTGSGKSSTLAAMIRRIADTRYHHIVTIEDPIEFLSAAARMEGRWDTWIFRGTWIPASRFERSSPRPPIGSDTGPSTFSLERESSPRAGLKRNTKKP